MMSFELTVDPPISAILARLPDGPKREQVLDQILDRGRFPVLREVMRNMPTKTGTMRRAATSSHAHLVSRIEIGSGYAHIVDQGAAPHVIVPRLATMLRFVPAGGANPEARLTGRARRGSEAVYVFARAVNHPGQAGVHFIETGLQDAMPEFERLMKEGAATLMSGA